MPPRSYALLNYEVNSDGIATISLNRPPVNAVNREMYIEIAELFKAPDQMSNALRAIVLAGSGTHFCAGNDLDEFASMTPDNGTERMWRVREAFFAIQFCPVPVIAAVHGVALGTGLAIAASCDVIVAADTAKFGLPELSVGVLGGARHLSRLAPQHLVRRMFFTGQPMTADSFAQAGGAISVCTADELHEQAYRIAQRIASFSPTAVRHAKYVLNRIESMDIVQGYTFEQQFTVMMSGHPDSKEALRAVAERRQGVYQEPSSSTGAVEP